MIGVLDARQQQEPGGAALDDRDVRRQPPAFAQPPHRVDAGAVIAADYVAHADDDGRHVLASVPCSGFAAPSSSIALGCQCSSFQPVTMLDSSPFCSSMSISTAL